MARSGRPEAELVLTVEERARLQRWARRATSAQALALRSRIVLACADGADNKTVAASPGCAAATVGKWRAWFVEHRLDGLTDEARLGRPATFTVDQIEDVVVATLGVRAEQRDALVAGHDGRADRDVEVHDRPNLEGVRAQAAPR